MAHMIDSLAGKWLDWRMGSAINADPELEEMQFKRMEVTEGGYTLVAMHPAIAVLAADAAQLLNDAKAENYVQFDMMPRLDRGIRPIRVTVAWANGLSPATKAARLQEKQDAAIAIATQALLSDGCADYGDAVRSIAQLLGGNELLTEIKDASARAEEPV